MHPKLVKHVIFPVHEKLVGRSTYQYLEELEKLQWASRAELEALRFQKLKALLVHARGNIPFYAERFAEAGFDPSTMTAVDDFKVLPLLTKAEIRQNIENMQWKASPGGLTRYNTGGSSGEPLVFYFDRRRQAYDAAARALTHRWWGIDIGDKELYLWGSPLEITKQDRIKDIRDMLTNQLLISAFEISPQQIPDIVEQFRKFKPKSVFGYPSTIALFCRMAQEQGFHLDDLGVEVIFSAAEVLYDHQRESIGDYFGGKPVVDSYGSREAGFISHECKDGTYHIIDPNFVLEFIKDGRPAADGEDGEIVVTHLDAWGMPFIRYRTGDVACPKSEACACGRGFSGMEKIRGRTTDFVVTPDGRWQHALSIIYVVRDIEGVDEFKIIQNAVDDVTVLLKVHEGMYPPDGNQRIVNGFKKRMGSEVQVDIQMTDHIPRDASGKYRYVVSQVAEAGFAS
jgi:phenylacetate-CoA ligase